MSQKRKRYTSKYLEIAQVWSDLSHAKRKKVGCIIVKDDMIISDGYNGTPAGLDNKCEDDSGKTKWYVIHAEANAILKLSRSHNSSVGATLYSTLSPCKDCAKMILQAGIKEVYYKEKYKDSDGINFLNSCNVKCELIN
jgi:dCMP deaminase